MSTFEKANGQSEAMLTPVPVTLKTCKDILKKCMGLILRRRRSCWRVLQSLLFRPLAMLLKP